MKKNKLTFTQKFWLNHLTLEIQATICAVLMLFSVLYFFDIQYNRDMPISESVMLLMGALVSPFVIVGLLSLIIFIIAVAVRAWMRGLE